MPTDYACQVLENRPSGRGLKTMRLQVTGQYAQPFACAAGQFVMLDLPVTRFHFRRPFSVLDTPEPGVFEIYYKIVGEGTLMMAEMGPGQTLKVLGPLGNSFSAPTQPETALYIGGGIGIAPLHLMGKSLPQAGHCVYGVRNMDEIGLERELQQVFGADRVHIATDDGSYGHHGNVCDLLRARPELAANAKEAYICGPMRMMEATANLLHETNPAMRIEVSLEEHMPCGTGACTGCVVPRADQYLPSKICCEGPVFEARQIAWPTRAEPFPGKAVAACPS